MNCPLCLGSNITQFACIEEKEYFKCSHCHLIFLNRINHLLPAEEKERYSQHNNDINNPQYRSINKTFHNCNLKYYLIYIK